MEQLATHPMIAMREDATVREVAALMADYRIGAVGVLGQAKEFRGIFTERDLVSSHRGEHRIVSIRDLNVPVDPPQVQVTSK